MTVSDDLTGNSQNADIRLAAAIRAVDAALAACEAARLMLLVSRPGEPVRAQEAVPVAQDEQPPGCPHPASELVRASTFGGATEVFCKACGERPDQ